MVGSGVGALRVVNLTIQMHDCAVKQLLAEALQIEHVDVLGAKITH